MTREEILNGLYDIKSWHCNGNSEMYRIIAEAITVLEQELCEDCINRHKAIIQLSHNKTGNDDVDVVVQKDIETIKALPPVTPGSTSCDVAISKQAAIDAVNIGNLNPGIVEALQSILAELPPVTPQQKIGKWLHREDMDYLDENKVVNKHFMCGECGFIHNFKDGHTSQYNYCPNCGNPKMQEVEE